ncbi:MAG: hypothetical protein JWP89_1201 [Schlesneria sp.]|nr:hypothetical protein [Schlesneria sp.]
MKRVLKGAVELLKDQGFAASRRDPKDFIRQVGNQLHGMYFLCNSYELRVRVQFHYTFLETFNFVSQEEPSVPLAEFRSVDFVFNAELADFERPVGRTSSWDSERKEFRDWDPTFIESKAQLALDVLQSASIRWQDPLVIMDQLVPKMFEYRVHKLGFGLQDGQDAPVAGWLFRPWYAEDLQLCCLAASIATRYGYGETLVPEYEKAYRDMIAIYEANGLGTPTYMDLIRLRQDHNG